MGHKEKLEIVVYLLILAGAIILSQHMNVVVSGSMEPVLYRGDIVIVENANFLGIQEFNPGDVKKGDIIIYDANWFPEPVIHRVIEINKDESGETFYITKGDNNPVPDPEKVKPSQLRARVIKINNYLLVIPKIGYVTIWIKGL